MSLHIGDIGTVIEIIFKDGDTYPDISDAEVIEIVFKKPDKTAVRKIATFTTDGSDAKIRYIMVSGDVNAAGTWHYQGYVKTPSGEWHSDESTFVVAPILQ